MNRFTKAVALGSLAGVIDVLPMVALNSNGWAMASAFAHWLVSGVLIVYVRAAMRPWLKGLLIGAASAVPVVLMVYPVEPQALAPITLMSLLLGSGVGYFAGKFCTE